MSQPAKRCKLCGSRLIPCPARWDGEATFVGFYACPCDAARDEDAERDEWKAPVRYALIPHPEEYRGYLDIELLDERQATRLAAAYDDGAYKTVERILGRWATRGRETFDRAMPSYAELRDYLQFENNVPLVLAARIALRLTRYRSGRLG